MSFHNQISSFEVSIVDCVVEGLQKSCPNFESVRAVLQNLGYKVLDNVFGWTREEVNLLQSFWLVLQCFFSLGVERVMLVVNVLKFNDSNFSYFFLFVFLLAEIVHDAVALSNENALIPKSVEVFHVSLRQALEGFIKLLVQFFDEVDQCW